MCAVTLRRACVAVLVMVASGAVTSVSGQQRPIADPAPALSTDRPGFNAPAAVVGAGDVQVELGWALRRDRDGGRSSDGPEPLLRVGLARGLELQLSSPGFEATCALNCRWLPADMLLGARWVFPGTPWETSLAVTGGVALPTGHRDVTSHHVEPSVVLHADRELWTHVGLSYNLVVTRTYDVSSEAAYRLGHGLAVGYEVGRWSPYVAVARRPMRVGGDTPWVAQFGSAYRLGDDVQVDVTVDRGLTPAEPRWGVSAGLAIRRRRR